MADFADRADDTEGIAFCTPDRTLSDGVTGGRRSESCPRPRLACELLRDMLLEVERDPLRTLIRELDRELVWPSTCMPERSALLRALRDAERAGTEGVALFVVSCWMACSYSSMAPETWPMQLRRFARLNIAVAWLGSLARTVL